MKCKNCDGKNVIEGVVFGYHDPIHNIGPRYKEFVLFSSGQETYCDLCEDCGEIQRFYINPATHKKWMKSSKSRDEMLENMTMDRISENDIVQIKKEVNRYEEILASKQVRIIYVQDLHHYEKHELYEFPIKTKGPDYRLYRELSTRNVVMIKPSTMNLDKGKYVVCIPSSIYE